MSTRARRLARRALEEARWIAFDSLKAVRKTVTVRTQQGRLTVACADGTIARHLFARRNYELSYVSKVLALLREAGGLGPPGTGTVLDVGANLGVISIGMLYREELARAVALEPEPRNFELLTRNVRQNGLSERMVCLELAVSSTAGRAGLQRNPTNFGDHRVQPIAGDEAAPGEASAGLSGNQAPTVQTTTLDSLPDLVPAAFLDDLALVWIDVQGHEGHVLAGGQSILSRGIPVVCEIWPHGLALAGTTVEAFCNAAQRLWPAVWIARRGKLIRYPISFLPQLFHELDGERLYDNVLFWR